MCDTFPWYQGKEEDRVKIARLNFLTSPTLTTTTTTIKHLQQKIRFFVIN
jgi:hypothetical protein